MENKKDLATGCAVIFVFGIITLGIGILIGKYWL